MAQHKASVRKKGRTQLVLTREQHPIRAENFSRAALKTCETLRKKGYKAYLVGGCIRDLLQGITPKDFDIATDATPEKVHMIFSASRIIGRRFKIVHVLYRDELIEVTTFRCQQNNSSKNTVSDDQGMLLRDNTYGRDPAEDSDRRDFSINAIYFDPEDESLIDFHGGLFDLNHQIIDIIGDPKTRYAEDPVRMIRAVRFKAKLGFELSKRTEKAIFEQKNLLANISNARMFDEVNKLFLSGHGQASLNELISFDLLNLLMPSQKSIVDSREFHDFVNYALQASDERTSQGRKNKPYFLYAVLLFTKVRTLIEKYTAKTGDFECSEELIGKAASRALYDQSSATDIPSVIYNDITELYHLYFSLFSEYMTRDELNEIVSNPRFRASFDLLKLRAHFESDLQPFVEFYKPYYDESSRKSEERRKKRLEKRNEKSRLKRDSVRNYQENAGSKTYSSKKNGFESDTSQQRQERLEKARAWRLAMNLDP